MKIFNYLIKVYYKLLKALQYNYKSNIIFIIIWIYLYNYGYIIENRLIYFLCILLYICIYKIICKNLQGKDYQFNENLLYIILWIDYIKLLWIKILIFLFIYLHYLYINKVNIKLIKILILIFENIITNPFKIILYKFYYILNIWRTTSIVELFFKRIHGSVLSILVFSNIIGYIWYMLNYSYINVYFLLLVLNMIDELVKSGKINNYWIYKYIKYIEYLNFNKDLYKIIENRSSTSIFSLYIQNILRNIKLGYKVNKIKKFAFIINDVYLIRGYTNIKFSIINHKIHLKKYKFYKWDYVFKPFYISIVSCLNNYFILFATIDYLLIKVENDTDTKYNFTLKDLLKLKEYTLLVTKMLLYYLWDFENAKAINENKLDFNFSNLIINEISTINEFEYELTDWDLLMSRIKYIKYNNIKMFDIENNLEFYDQFYLYALIFENYDLNNNKFIFTEIIDFESYKNIESFSISILDQVMKISAVYGIDIIFYRANDSEVSVIEPIILEKLNEYKKMYMEEWIKSKSKNVEEANIERLEKLNEYIIKNK